MPIVFVFCGFRFMFYSNDHEPVHVHIVKGKVKIKEYTVYQVIPETVLIDNHGLKPNELKLAEMVIEENREIIVENWNRFFGKNTQQ